MTYWRIHGSTRFHACRVAACIVTAIGCGGDLGSESPRPSSRAVLQAEFIADTATVRVPLLLPAQLYVEHDAIVVARTAGTVDSIFVELGDKVVGGQKLAVLESAAQVIELANAEAAFDNASLIAARTRSLTGSGGTTKADSEQVEFDLRKAAIARQNARRELELTRVMAPFDGVVSARAVRPYHFASPGDTLFRVTETDPLFARVRVPEASVSAVRIGETATILGPNGARAAATIVHAAPVIDAASGTREVVLRITRSSAALRAGANVTVRVGHDQRRVLAVPREAIAPEGYVLVLDNGRSTMRTVVTGATLDDNRVEVLSGLSAGEQLLRPRR